MKKDFIYDWLFVNKEKSVTISEVKELLEKIKEFNAGAVDKPLSNHIDKVFKEWECKIK